MLDKITIRRVAGKAAADGKPATVDSFAIQMIDTDGSNTGRKGLESAHAAVAFVSGKLGPAPKQAPAPPKG